MSAHPMQASPAAAEAAFGFLVDGGFTLRERFVSGGDTFRDGWRLTFAGPRTEVVVQYLDTQFEVHFVRDGVDISYLEMDRDLFDRRSGFHGDMFPPEKLQGAIERIALDIQQNYGATLAGDDEQWRTIARIKQHPRSTRKLP